jgi:hypothetical protein
LTFAVISIQLSVLSGFSEKRDNLDEKRYIRMVGLMAKRCPITISRAKPDRYLISKLYMEDGVTK